MEEISIACHVEANPPATWFQWSFNNSADRTREVERFESKGHNGRIVVKYIPASDRDYGTLLCWASNDIGSQSTPCIFHVVPAGKPRSSKGLTSAVLVFVNKLTLNRDLRSVVSRSLFLKILNPTIGKYRTNNTHIICNFVR